MKRDEGLKEDKRGAKDREEGHQRVSVELPSGAVGIRWELGINTVQGRPRKCQQTQSHRGHSNFLHVYHF